MADPSITGQRVLSALAAGRQRAIAAIRRDAEPVERAVRAALDRDILAGHPPRGRAKRIASDLTGRVRVKAHGCYRDTITERGVLKILERLSNRSDSIG